MGKLKIIEAVYYDPDLGKERGSVITEELSKSESESESVSGLEL